MTNATTTPAVPGEFRVVELGKLTIRDGFNPRTGRDPDRFAQTVASVRQTGVLQPILVTPNGDEDRFCVVAGEGRYRAAVEAGLAEVPVIVCAVDERTGGLELAIAENLVREDLDPVAQARGFHGLREAGWSKKGIAEFFDVSQKLVTERLQILELPEQLHPHIATGQIPTSAIKPLVALAKLHPGLPAVVTARVGAAPSRPWAEPLDWPQVIEDPIAALISDFEGDELGLPADVYDAGESYPVERFTLSEKATKDLRALCKLLHLEPEQFGVRFGREAVEQALALKAAHATKNGWHHVIVGQDVADQLAGDYVAACLKQQRANARRQREQAAHDQHTDGIEDSGGAPEPVSEEEAKEQRRQQRAAEQEARRAAAAYNVELGAAVLKHLARVKVDARVLKTLAAVDVGGELGQIAARGARYGFPGWPQHSETKSGKAKTEYLTTAEAAGKAREFLDGATTPADIAGRVLALLVMAHYAKEACVANSNRSFYELRQRDGLPWSDGVLGLVEEIAEERLPEHLTAHVREQREHAAAAREAEQQAAAAADELRARLDDLTADERLQALREFGAQHGRHTVVAHWLRQDVLRRNAQDERTDDQHAGDPGPDSPTDAGEAPGAAAEGAA
jgi:ParB family chromosome partitioning protein